MVRVEDTPVSEGSSGGSTSGGESGSLDLAAIKCRVDSAENRQRLFVERQAEILDTAREIGKLVGELQGAEGCTEADLVELRDCYTRLYDEAFNARGSHPHFHPRVQGAYNDARDLGYAESVQKGVINLSVDVGCWMARRSDPDGNESRAKLDRLATYVEHHRSILAGASEYRSVTDRKMMEAETRGLSMRLECEKTALDLYRDSAGIYCTGFSPNFSKVVVSLEGLVGDELELTKALFRERTDLELADRLGDRFNLEKFEDEIATHKGTTPADRGPLTSGATKALRIQHLVRGERGEAAGVGIAQLLSEQYRDPSEGLVQLLLKLSVDERKEAVAYFNEHLTHSRCSSFHQALKRNRRIDHLEEAQIVALIEGDIALFRAARIRVLVHQPKNEEQVIGLVEDLSPKELEETAIAHDNRFKRPVTGYDYTFRDYVETFMNRTSAKEIVLAYIRGDRIGAMVAEVKRGIGQLDGSAIARLFLDKSLEERKELCRTFRAREGRPLINDSLMELEDELDPLDPTKSLIPAIDTMMIEGVDRDLLVSAIVTGRYSPEALVRHALLLDNPDVEAICKVFEKLSPEESLQVATQYSESYDDISRGRRDIVALGVDSFVHGLLRCRAWIGDKITREQFRKFPGGTRLQNTVDRIADWHRGRMVRLREPDPSFAHLHNDMKQKLSGTRLTRAIQISQGTPADFEAAVQRMENLTNDAISGYGLGAFLIRSTNCGKLVAKDFHNLKALAVEEEISVHRDRVLNTHLQLARINSDEVIGLKHKLGEEVGNWGSAGAVIGVVSFAYFTALPIAAKFSLVLAVSGATRVVAKHLAKGTAYSWRNDLPIDFGYGVADALSFAMVGPLARWIRHTPMYRTALRATAKFGVRQMVTLSHNKRQRIRSENVTYGETIKDVTIEVALKMLRV